MKRLLVIPVVMLAFLLGSALGDVSTSSAGDESLKRRVRTLERDVATLNLRAQSTNALLSEIQGQIGRSGFGGPSCGFGIGSNTVWDCIDDLDDRVSDLESNL